MSRYWVSVSKMGLIAWVTLGMAWPTTGRAVVHPLREIANNISWIASAGKVPIVISDLDETLVDSSMRRWLALQGSMRSLCSQERQGVCGQVAGINLQEIWEAPNLYADSWILDRVGVIAGPWRDRLMKGLLDRYLSGDYLEFDQAIPGAMEYVQELRARGAEIFYVSSRWADRQGSGTLDSLRDLGMMPGQGSEDHLILRPSGMDSLTFKRESFERIQRYAAAHNGVVSLVMENEPENMNAMVELFPQAAAVFVEGAWLNDLPVVSTAVRVSRFR